MTLYRRGYRIFPEGGGLVSLWPPSEIICVFVKLRVFKLIGQIVVPPSEQRGGTGARPPRLTLYGHLPPGSQAGSWLREGC